MSNQYNPENTNSEKNKMPEIIELSDDEMDNNNETRELEMKRLHYRKNIDKDWFSEYTWC
jgi:hypothetical protein